MFVLSRLGTRLGSIRYVALVAVVTLLVGCTSDDPTVAPELVGPTEVPGEANVLLAEADKDAAVTELARSVAIALAEPRARQAVLKSMRRSNLNERKVDLESFVSSAAGSEIMDSARKRGTATRSELSTLLEKFDRGLDFYAPSDDQRRSWTGSANILVAGVARSDATEAIAFDTDGRSRTITILDIPGVDIVFSLHPAEAKLEAATNQSVEGTTIEDPMNFETTAVTYDQVCQVECGGGDGGGGGGGGGGDPTEEFTRINRIAPDFDDCFLCGDLELYLITIDENELFSQFHTGVFTAEPRVLNIVNILIHPKTGHAGLPLRATLFEDDNDVLNDGDDFKGESLPDITSQGGYQSFDPFIQHTWATYNVVTGCVPGVDCF